MSQLFFHKEFLLLLHAIGWPRLGLSKVSAGSPSCLAAPRVFPSLHFLFLCGEEIRGAALLSILGPSFFLAAVPIFCLILFS